MVGRPRDRARRSRRVAGTHLALINQGRGVVMQDFMALAERAWQGQLDLMFEHHPVHAVYAGAAEIEPNLLVLKGIAAIYVFDTSDGLVMLDAGSRLDIERTFKAVREWRPDVPMRYVVFSHHHVDHVFATQPFTDEAKTRGWPVPIVVAHELTGPHFDRYKRTLGYNTVINRRQFAIHAPHFRWPEDYRYPDETYADTTKRRVGNLTFELIHARGETDDHTWTWIPEQRIVMTGDLFIWAVPNAGNPQKVQRYVGDWAKALRAMAAKQPRLLLPGHGFPILGEERVQQALTDTADFLDLIEDQVLAGMNSGLTLDTIYQKMVFPESLMQRPYLKPIYDDAAFLVRMIWRLYGGWWDGEYDSLMPAPKKAIAQTWLELAGGVSPVLAQAEALCEDQPEIAAHLVEAAFHAEPESAEVHRVRGTIYRARAAQQTSSMARNLFNHAALSSDAGVRDLASTNMPHKERPEPSHD